MIETKNITKKYGADTVLENISLSFPDRSKNVIMGDSGRGKTTLLRIIAGLEPPDSGTVSCPLRIAYMFQEPRLLPWKNAIDNVKAFLPRKKYDLADKYINAVGLSNSAKKRISELSGGMAQRVAFARFLAYAEANNAELLLLDEPFSALDVSTAKHMIDLLVSVSDNKTVILVTHDTSQAEIIGDTTVYL